MGAWIMSSDRGLAWIRARTRGQVLAAHLPFLVLYFACGYLEMHTMNGMANHRLLFAFASTIVVVWQAANMTSWLALPNWRPLAYMGRISYGLYCLHPIGLLVAVQGQHLMGWDTQVWQVVVLQSVIALSFTIALAAFSYRFYESPFLRLKQRLSHIRR
jgi:peptidoglycan/LPS O-acetylase OafA/YrhL